MESNIFIKTYLRLRTEWKIFLATSDIKLPNLNFQKATLPAFLALFGISSMSALVLTAVLFTSITQPITHAPSKYAIFSSKPLVAGTSSESLLGADARAAALDGLFSRYNCPLSGYGKVFVEEADKNNIPWWLVPAVSFQESNCGKKTPEHEGKESYNAYGWGVWGDNIKFFDNWEHGIKVVSSYFGEHFYAKGIKDPCEIMKTYTPPSKGSWCEGVNYFKGQITNYETL